MSTLEPKQKVIRLFEFGDFLLDMDMSLEAGSSKDNRLLYTGNPYDEISDRSFKLLCLFVQEPNRDFPREELLNGAWPEHKLSPHELDPRKGPKTHRKADDEKENWKRVTRNKLQHEIAVLRKHLAKKSDGADRVEEQSIVTTEIGYKFALLVETREIGEKADLNFDKWILQNNNGRGISYTILLGILLTGIYLIGHLAFPDRFSLPPIVVFSLVQCLLVGIAWLVRKRVFDPKSKVFWKEDPLWLLKKFGYEERNEWKSAKTGAASALSQYAAYWTFLLASWFFIYAILAVFTLLGTNTSQSVDVLGVLVPKEHFLYVLAVALTAANNCNSLATILCFIILDNPTAYGNDEKQKDHRRRLREITKWGAAGITLFAILELVLLFVFQVGKQLSVQDNPVLNLSDISSGIVGGITLALYVGRVQTRFLGPSPWLPLAFYLYAVIQSLFVNITVPGLGEVIIVSALILKGLLFLYVAWLFQSGRLLFYYVRVKAIFERVDLDWRIFLSIMK